MRIVPQLAPDSYVTYGIATPVSTHHRPASCEEVECENYLSGWKTILPAGSDLIDVLRRAGRSYTERKLPEGLVEFVFKAGQPCFQASQHTTPIGRPEVFLRSRGDWRSNLGERPFIHKRAEDWVEDFALNQQALHDAQERG